MDLEPLIEWLWGSEPIVAIQEVVGPDWVWAAEVASWLGTGQAAALTFAIAYWVTGRRLAMRVLTAVVLGMLIVSLFWFVFGIERPDAPTVQVRVTPGVPSFPSGHVTAAVTLWGSLALTGRAPLAVPLLAVPLVALSRLVLGAHYVADVLFAVPVGLGVLAAHQRFYPVLVDWIGRLSARGRLGMGLGGALLVLPAVWLVDEGWLLFGAALGAGLGLPAEPLFVRYEPVPVGRRRVVLRVAIGLAPLALVALPLFGGTGHAWQLALAASGVLWVVLGAPALFVRLGLAGNTNVVPVRGTPWNALAAIAATAVGAALLTLWLFPSLWAVGQASADIDQSAGTEMGVNLTEVANNPEPLWGRTVTISGRIVELVDSQTLIIGNDAFFVGDKVPVVSAQLGTDLATLVENPEVGALRHGELIRVTSVVRPLEREGLRSKLEVEPVAALMDPDELAVLAAEAIELDPPEHIVAGDKEFPSGGSGYEIGISVNDIVHRTDDYLGAVVEVSDEIDEPALGPRAFVLGDEQLLVLKAGAEPETFVEATAYVIGEVVRFDVATVEAQLGVDLDDAALARFAGEPAIVARWVEVVA